MKGGHGMDHSPGCMGLAAWQTFRRPDTILVRHVFYPLGILVARIVSP
jgi:hypothetical protein